MNTLPQFFECTLEQFVDKHHYQLNPNSPMFEILQRAYEVYEERTNVIYITQDNTHYVIRNSATYHRLTCVQLLPGDRLEFYIYE